ncbi:MAG: cbb3-type cytochrome c oxidase subunit I [Acidimicrobiales bacterium]|nr:cbb3-type cytochrome c oxidase subunit I [Acidimicrobiales bacterium]
MTVTESKPEDVAPEMGHDADQPALPSPPSGLLGVLATADHKTVGRLYVGFSLLFLIVFLGTTALITAEGIDASTLGPLAENTFFQVQTISHVGVFFLGIVPAFLGLALFVVPLQVGSTTAAFPRAVAASFWGWLLGAVVLIGAYLADGGPTGGQSEAVLLFFVAWAMVIAALALGAISVISTVATARTKGMSLLRVPAFSWAMLVACSIWLFNLAAMVGNLVIVYIDTKYDAVLYGASSNRWAQVSWIFAQPAVLGFAIPILGIVHDAVPVAARIRPVRFPVTLGAIGAFGALTFGAYAQTAFNPDLVHEALFVAASVAVVLPLLALLAGAADTVRQGRLRPTSAFVLGMVSLLLLLAAGAAAALYAIEPLNLAYTTWGTGVEKLVIAASVAGLAAGLFHWGSKMWGHGVAEPIGKLVMLVFLAGGAAFAGGDLIAGANGQLPTPANGLSKVVADGAELGALISTIGAGLLVFGVLLVVLAVLPAALRTGARADADPWGGHTLEWSTSSPPPFGNFVGPIPEVASPSPLLDIREATKESA